MKQSKILYLLAILTLGAWLGSPASAQPGVTVSFQTFYNELSPYGRWTSHPQYGSIWTPYDVDRDFQPYASNGQWMMTEYGNTWVSDYDWGWAPFHYGRWFYEDYYGWAWVPDYQWGPAWVDWRSGGGYYGWAPLWPGVRVGVSFNIPFNFWVFVPQRYVYRPRVFGYRIYGDRYRNVYNQTTIINNYYQNDNRVYSYGPRRSEIEQATRGSVPVYRADELRSNRNASARQNSDGSYRANGSSESGLYRENRNNGNATSNRSGRQGVEAEGGTSNRTYDAGSSSRSRGSYEAGSSRSNESSAPSRTYESGEPSSRSRSNYDNRTSAPPSGPSTYSAPSRSYESNEPSSRTRSGYDRSTNPTQNSSPSSRSYESGESSRTRSNSEYNSNSPRTESAPSRSSSPRMESVPSRSSSPRMESAPSRSSSPRMEAPASRSRNSETAPRSNSGSSSSSSSSSSSRSRGPR